MGKLRENVRAAFADEQAKLGDLGGARHRLMTNAIAARDRGEGHGRQWIAAVAAFVLAAIVIASLVLVRAGGSPRVVPAATPSPRAIASPTPLSQPLSVPDSTPVILYHDPARFDQLDGMTWDGRISGRVGAGVANGGVSNPQGSLYSTMTDIRDRSGHVVAALDITKASVFWADDGRQFCAAVRVDSRDVSGPGELQVGGPGEQPRNVARVGTFAPASSNGGGPYVVACSLESDRGVVVESGGQGISTVAYWVVQLSTGRVLWSRVPGASASPVEIIASRDGRYVAENHSEQTGEHTIIYGPDGAAAAYPGAWVDAFSWDGTLAVTSPTWTGGPVTVIRWSDGKVVWSGPAGSGFGYWQGAAEPGGTSLAIGVRDPAFPQTTGFAPVDLYVISGAGQVVLAKKDVYLFTP
jgi:hypothetical protein